MKRTLAFLLTAVLLTLQSLAEVRNEKSIKEQEKDLLELKSQIEEIKKHKDYKDQLDSTEKNIDALLSILNSEKMLIKSDQSYRQLVENGKESLFEDFYKIIPEKLSYKIPKVPNNSYFDFSEFWEGHEWPALNSEEMIILEKIEKFEKVSGKDLEQIKEKLKVQKKLFEKAMSILKKRPFIYSPEKTIVHSSDLSSLRSMAKFLSHSALIKFREGQKEAAIQLVRDAYSLGLVLEKRKGPFLDLLVSDAIKGIARYRARWILTQKNITEKQILSFEALTQEDEKLQAWEDAAKFELYFSSRMMYAEPLEDIDLDFDAEETKKEIEKIPADMEKVKSLLLKFTSDTDSFLKDKDKDKKYLKYCSFILSHILKDLEHFPAKGAVMAKSYLTELIKVHDNLIWKQVLTSLAVYNVLVAKVSYSQNRTNALKTIIAFRLYEIRRHSSPKNMDALVEAGLLKEAVLDAWSGEALKFDPVKRKIYFDGNLKYISREIEF